MSLFGGDSSAPPTESEYESGSDNLSSPIEQPPPTTHLQSLPSAHNELNLQTPAVDDTAHDSASNDADSEESDDEEPVRPNRFRGPPQTWKGYTAVDRQIAESLQQLEDTDLAAHLYNAHALKRRVRKPAPELSTLNNWQNKDAWLKQGKQLQHTDAVGQLQTELVPAKDWTAWPLPSASLYTLSNGFRKAAMSPMEDEWVIGGSGALDPGEELKDEAMALFLRLAKENWNAKDWNNDDQQAVLEGPRSRARSRSQSDHSDVGMKDGSGDESTNSKAKLLHEGGVKRGRKPQVGEDIKPAVLADDAKAQRLLRPTIDSLLNKLDGVALALQRTRLNHFGRGNFGEGSSQSEFTTDAETTERESLSRSPRNRPETRQSSRPISSRASRAPKSPRKISMPVVEPEDSDSASDYGAQFGNNAALDSKTSRSSTSRQKRRRSESTADEEDVSNTRDWSRAGLMDWSEILGIAAMKGWDQKALARTVERCASLFGESMSFKPFDDDLAATSTAEPVHYTPSSIPVPGSSIVGAPRPTKRPYWQTGALRCPHTDCYGHHKDFRFSYRVVEHCIRQHGYDPRHNDSDNEERTYGGVHIDGFLQPITAKQGWLGHGRSKAGGKKRKTEEVNPADTVGVAAEIEGEDAQSYTP